MRKRIFFLALCLLSRCFLTFASNGTALVKFTENKGQWESNVLFRAQLDGGVLFLEKNCFTYSFYEKEKLSKNHIRSPHSNPTKEDLEIKSHAFRVTLKNALPPQSVHPERRSTNYTNFFIGNNPAQWASHAYDYEMVYYKSIYAGIDLEVIGKENSMKYNFIIHPGADASKICLSYMGVKKITNENGALKIETPLTTIIESRPYAYQEINGTRITVPCHFTVNNNEVTFSLSENYRADIPLIIDPTLIFSSYSGSFADNFGMTATFDNFGNLYAGGTAFDQGYPTTPSAFDTTYNGIDTVGRTDVVISKYDSAGSNLLYSTYLGGAAGTEIVTSLIVNSNNELMLFGMTGSSDFPVTPTAFDNSFSGGSLIILNLNGTHFYNGTDIYVAKFSADGSQLLASTYVGGTENDGVVDDTSALQINYGDFFRGEIQTDIAGNFYVASTTYSLNFPVTAGAFQTIHGGGGNDGCIFKMSSDLSQMLWCSYLGGSSEDASFALALDTNQNVYVTGGTRGGGFPSTPTAVNDTFVGGIADAYITKIKADGTAILSSTFAGTNLFDQSYFIQTDTLQHVYIFGQSTGNFPITGNVYSNPGSKQYVAIFSSGLDTLLYSTVYGDGTNNIKLSPAAFLVDRCGNIYCSGWGGPLTANLPMNNMPVTNNAYQPNSANGYDFHFIVFGPYLQILEYGTYFGGGQSKEHVDGGTSRFDPKGILYQSVCAGCWGNSDFPTTSGSWSNTNNSGLCNNGVIKMDLNVQDTKAAFTAFPKSACPYVNVTFTNQSIAGYNFTWNFGDGSPVSNSVHATHSYSAGGTYYVSLIASSPFCGVDTAFDTIYVYTPPVAAFGHSGLYCNSINNVQFNNTSVNADSSFWRFGDSDTSTSINPSHTYPSPGNYTVSLIVVDTVGCSDTTQQNVIIFAEPSAVFTYSLNPCILDVSFSGTLVPGLTYDWNFGDSTSGIGQGISHTYSQEGSYDVTLMVTDGNGCKDSTIQTVSPFTSSLAEFSYNTDSCSLMTVFVNQSQNALFNYWNFGDNTSATSTNPVHGYLVRGSYMVTLIINQGTICADTIVKNLVLDEGNFADYFIPNIFTPNGDSYNARFTIKGFDFCNEFMVKVYNRWGELLFEATDILDSWDGTFKGKDVPEGVYFYIVKGKKVNRNGTVTVKRN